MNCCFWTRNVRMLIHQAELATRYKLIPHDMELRIFSSDRRSSDDHCKQELQRRTQQWIQWRPDRACMVDLGSVRAQALSAILVEVSSFVLLKVMPWFESKNNKCSLRKVQNVFPQCLQDHQTFRQGEQIKVYIITWNTVTKNSIGTARKNLEPIFCRCNSNICGARIPKKTVETTKLKQQIKDHKWNIPVFNAVLIFETWLESLQCGTTYYHSASVRTKVKRFQFLPRDAL